MRTLNGTFLPLTMPPRTLDSFSTFLAWKHDKYIKQVSGDCDSCANHLS